MGAPSGAGQFGHDFTLQAVMELQKSFGALESRVGALEVKTDRLISDVKSQGDKLDKVRDTISFVRGVAWVTVALIAAFGSLAVWYAKTVITPGLLSGVQVTAPAPTATPPAPTK